MPSLHYHFLFDNLPFPKIAESRDVHCAVNVPSPRCLRALRKQLQQNISPGELLLFSHQVVFDSAIPWTAAHQDFLFLTSSQSLLRFLSIESVMLSNHLILCRLLLFLPSVFPSIGVFSNELAKVFELQHQSFQ